MKGGNSFEKIKAIVLMAVLLLLLSGYQGENASTPNSDIQHEISQTFFSESENVSPPSTGNVLILYFTRVGNTDFSDDVDAISSASLNLRNGTLAGNTELVAIMIQQETGGELFRIQTEKISG